MVVEQVDLARLTDELARRNRGDSLEGFVRGRTFARDVVRQFLACSELEAEQLVDTLVGRGFLRFSADPSSAAGGGVWTVRAGA